MRTPSRSSSLVVFGVLVALTGACQKNGDALLYVTVKASPLLRGVETVDVIVTKVADAAPRASGPLHYPCPDGGVDIGSSGETLTVIVPGGVGPVTVTAVARGAGGSELARGTSSAVDPHAGSITNVTVTFGSSTEPDGGTSDGTSEGGAGQGGVGGAAGSGEAGGNGGGQGGAGAGQGGAGAGGGTSGAGGAAGTAGTVGTGGAGGTGGAAGTGGAGGTGGAAGAGGAPCVVSTMMACNTGAHGICATGMTTCRVGADQTIGWGPCVQTVAMGKRDCTSGLDNDCNGTPDNAESLFCKCAPGSQQACSTGLNGICMAGTQICAVSSDKMTSAWGACAQTKAKGIETCANPGTDDDCDGVIDNVPSVPCNVGSGLGACLNGGFTGCNGTTAVCNPSTPAIGDTTSTAWPTHSAPNGSWDWNCDGVVTKQYPDTAPPTPDCSVYTSTSVCNAFTPISYALNPFACGDYGDIGSEYCGWLAPAAACTNKSGQGTGYQQGCR
jgi:hypothetical protein